MQVMESIHSQSDMGHRTLDFFDNTSEDELPSTGLRAADAQEVDELEGSGTAGNRRPRRPMEQNLASQCERRRSIGDPDAEGYQRLALHGQQDEHLRFDDTPTMSFSGSVTELLSGEHSSPPRVQGSGRAAQSSATIECSGDQQAFSPPTPHSQNDQVLAAHAIAHEITLQALMRDERTLDRSLQTFAPLNGDHRASLLPASLRVHDPRSPRDQTFTSSPKSAATGNKKVHVMPPPIDTTGPRRSLPANLVRTPYPTTPETVRRKDFGRSPPPATPSSFPPSESILILSVRRCNPHSKPRVTSMVIPASYDFNAVKPTSDREKENRSRSVDFDDAEFFRQLRRRYHTMTGPIRLLSARSLSRIVVSGHASKAADAGYGWLHQPRSPRMLAYKGLSDSFGEEKILQHYHRPVQGQSRYAFVHWAHRLAGAPPVQTPQGDENVEATVERDLVRRMEQPEGLEFIVSWSVKRILLALMCTLTLSIAAALLWVFLGKSTYAASPSHGGFKDVGDRVVTGVVMGICILLLGLSGIAGWLGVSWLVM
ncbi:hypothetical protein B0A50_02615 [Salinomyces thailandicus]|uniref:Uncharacterized protein n=1 Tax=Salinomyces thailandicus TaxID=706561 RepID=A0A4U0U5T7_9PEZI|nr:hypothetical protein B0A50_02615 [Salinomyces thailandica]